MTIERIGDPVKRYAFVLGVRERSLAARAGRFASETGFSRRELRGVRRTELASCPRRANCWRSRILSARCPVRSITHHWQRSPETSGSGCGTAGTALTGANGHHHQPQPSAGVEAALGGESETHGRMPTEYMRITVLMRRIGRTIPKAMSRGRAYRRHTGRRYGSAHGSALAGMIREVRQVDQAEELEGHCGVQQHEEADRSECSARVFSSTPRARCA